MTFQSPGRTQAAAVLLVALTTRPTLVRQERVVTSCEDLTGMFHASRRPARLPGNDAPAAPPARAPGGGESGHTWGGGD